MKQIINEYYVMYLMKWNTIYLVIGKNSFEECYLKDLEWSKSDKERKAHKISLVSGI